MIYRGKKTSFLCWQLSLLCMDSIIFLHLLKESWCCHSSPSSNWTSHFVSGQHEVSCRIFGAFVLMLWVALCVFMTPQRYLRSTGSESWADRLKRNSRVKMQQVIILISFPRTWPAFLASQHGSSRCPVRWVKRCWGCWLGDRDSVSLIPGPNDLGGSFVPCHCSFPLLSESTLPADGQLVFNQLGLGGGWNSFHGFLHQQIWMWAQDWYNTLEICCFCQYFTV